VASGDDIPPFSPPPHPPPVAVTTAWLLLVFLPPIAGGLIGWSLYRRDWRIRACAAVLTMLSLGQWVWLVIVTDRLPPPLANGLWHDATLGLMGAVAVSIAVVVLRSKDDRTMLESRLAEQEQILNTIFENEPECVKLLNRHGEVLQINRAGLSMIEADSAEQVAGQCVYPLVAPKYRATFQQLTENVFLGKSGQMVFEIFGLKGTRRWMETHASPLYGPAGSVNAAVAVTRDITEKKRAEEEIKKLADERQKLTRRMVEVQEGERRHLARELHDEIGQVLSAISVNLKIVLDRASPANVNRLCESIGMVDRAIEQVRNLSLDLRPPILDDFGLEAALRWYAGNQAKRAGFQLHLSADGLNDDPPADLRNACFRIVQEAITNVVRHANASDVWIDVKRDERILSFSIRDNGTGIARTQAQKSTNGRESLGLVAMRDRAELLGGIAEFRGLPGGGTAVDVRIPIPELEPAGDDEPC
jgi:PAS domain S-box-containing protein